MSRALQPVGRDPVGPHRSPTPRGSSGPDTRLIALCERIAVGVEGLREDLRAALVAADEQACTAASKDTLPGGVQREPQGLGALELLTPDELARALRVDVRTLRAMRHEGSIPQPIQVGRLIRWRRADVEAWLGEQGA